MRVTIEQDARFNYVVKTEFEERVFKGKNARRDAKRYAAQFEEPPLEPPSVEERLAELEARVAALEGQP